MATFDEMARYACKVSGPGLTVWLDRFARESMAADFAARDDTRRTSWPGGPERTDDVVCVLRRRIDGKPAHLIVEVETEPRADSVARVGAHELLLAIEVRGVLADGPPVFGALLHLTGSKKGGPLVLSKSASHPGVLNGRRRSAAMQPKKPPPMTATSHSVPMPPVPPTSPERKRRDTTCGRLPRAGPCGRGL